MKKFIAVIFVASALSIALVGCGKSQSDKLPAEATEALENLDSIVQNYAVGTAPLIEIPNTFAQAIYDNADAIIGSDIKGAPIQLREYAETNMVYFDYSNDYSVVWDKTNGSVSVEATDTAERDEFAQKMHK